MTWWMPGGGMTREQACFNAIGMSLSDCYLKSAWITAEWLSAVALEDHWRVDELTPILSETAGILKLLSMYPLGLLESVKP